MYAHVYTFLAIVLGIVVGYVTIVVSEPRLQISRHNQKKKKKKKKKKWEKDPNKS